MYVKYFCIDLYLFVFVYYISVILVLNVKLKNMSNFALATSLN